MNNVHVVINLTLSEYPHTPPTNMRLTLQAGHVVAASVLFDQGLAFWTLLNVRAALSPPLQHPLLRLRIPMHLPLLTAEPLVVLPAGQTGRHEAKPAPEDPAPVVGLERVDFGTVRGGAVLEPIWVAIEVVEERDFQ